MRIEYLASIAIAAVAAGTGLAVHSAGSRSPEKQSTPAAAQLATLLAESVDPFLLRSGRPKPARDDALRLVRQATPLHDCSRAIVRGTSHAGWVLPWPDC